MMVVVLLPVSGHDVRRGLIALPFEGYQVEFFALSDKPLSV